MRRFAGSFQKNESGEIMLESTIILVSVLILLMVLLSLCFMYYQQSVMTTMANELSSAVAKNYKYYMADPDANQIEEVDVSAVTKYRLSLGKNKMQKNLNSEVKQPAQERFDLSSFGINSGNVNVSCEVNLSGIGRAYVKVTVQNNTEFLLSGILEGVGILGAEGFSAVSYAEITDMTEYTSLVNFANYIYGGLEPVSGIAKIYLDMKGIIEKLAK